MNYTPTWIPEERYEVVMDECQRLRNRLATYAEHIHMLMEGDTHHIGRMYEDLRADGFADEDGFPIYPEDEE